MLTMILLILVLAGAFGVFGFSLRLLGRIIGWMVGMAIVISIIRGVFGLIGAMTGVLAHALPVILLVGIGIFIGRRLRDGSGTIDNIRDRLRLDNVRDWVPFNNVQRPEQEILDTNGRVVR